MKTATAENIATLEQTHWACACAKHKPKGPGFYIKLNPNSRAKCRVCGATKANADKIKA